MNHKSLFLLSIFVSFLVLSQTISNADALEINYYFEENNTCAENLTNTVNVITVTDGSEFEFEADESYLIISSLTWGFDNNAESIGIELRTNSTTLEGTKSVIEPKQSNSGCGSDKDNYRHSIWTIYTPTGSQENNNISLTISETATGLMTYDDASITIIQLTDVLEEDIDWVYAKNSTTASLSSDWTTSGDASITFTPTENNQRWWILGSSQLDTGTATANFETRLNAGAGFSTTPIQSQEGEDIAEDLFFQMFSRGLVLSNSTRTIEAETRIDDPLAIGTNQRLHSQIFAMNLDKFNVNNSTFVDASTLVTDTGSDFHIEVADAELTLTNTDNVFSFGQVTKQADRKMEFRFQTDNTDTPTGQTSQSYDFSDGWDLDDRLANAFSRVQSLGSGTHSFEIDASGEGDNRNVQYRSMVLFSFEFAPFSFSETPDTDIITWSDYAEVMISLNQNVTDIVTWSDNATSTFSVSQDVTDTVTWSDFIETLVMFFSSVTDTVTWSDNSTMTFDVSQDVTDTVTWSDLIEMTLGISQDVTDTVTWSDYATKTLNISDIITDTVTWSDNSTMTFDVSQDVTDTVTWSDLIEMTLGISQDVTDTVTWSDYASGVLGASGNVTDTVTWSDTVEQLAQLSIEVDDDVFWSDTVEMAVAFDQSVDDEITWDDNNDMQVDYVMENTDDISWSDTVDSAVLTMTASVFDIIGWNDGAGYGFDPSDVPIIIINEGDTIINQGGTTTGGTPSPTIPDSDGDGLIDTIDQCPLQKETVNNFQDSDGCPDTAPIVNVPNVGLPLELTQLDVIDDNIALQGLTSGLQTEDLTVRWVGDKPITITGVSVADSPFTIQFDDLPTQVGSNQYGLTETDIMYTVKQPTQVCINSFNFECVDKVTYDIPVIVTGEIDGKVFQSEGRIRIDNSDRTNPYYIMAFGLFAIPVIAIIFFSKRRRSRSSVHRVKTDKVTLRVTRPSGERKPTGSTREKLSLGGTRKIMIRKDDTPQTNKRFSIRDRTVKKKNEPRFRFTQTDKPKKKRNLFGR